MRSPVLYNRKRKQLKVYASTSIGGVVLRKELYVKVNEYGYYLVVFFVNKHPIGEKVLRPRYKVVKKRERVYLYRYLRITIPCKLLTMLERVNIVVKIYRLGDRLGKIEYNKYVSSN